MLDINKLTELKEILNLKRLCQLSNVNYHTVKNKTLAHLKNPEKGKLTPIQQEKIESALHTKGLNLSGN